MNQTPHFIVLTGGPGVGKTTLLTELQRQGFSIVPEDARRIIKEQLETGGDGLPWKNKLHYAELMLQASCTSYEQQVSKNTDQYVFFDRGIPDTLTYIDMEGLAVEGQLLQEAKERRYHKKVFILPPWEAIYENDNERKQNWKEAEDTFNVLKDTYEKLGYETIEVPKITVNERVQFILKNIELKNY